MGVINVNDIAQKMLNGQCKGSQSVMDAEKLVTQKYKQVSPYVCIYVYLRICTMLKYVCICTYVAT